MTGGGGSHTHNIYMSALRVSTSNVDLYWTLSKKRKCNIRWEQHWNTVHSKSFVNQKHHGTQHLNKVYIQKSYCDISGNFNVLSIHCWKFRQQFGQFFCNDNKYDRTWQELLQLLSIRFSTCTSFIMIKKTVQMLERGSTATWLHDTMHPHDQIFEHSSYRCEGSINSLKKYEPELQHSYIKCGKVQNEIGERN